jgi:hypothetical protein
MIPTHKKKINAKKKDDPSGNHDRCLHYQSSKGDDSMIPTHKKKINAKKKDDPSGNHDRCLHYQSSKGESGRPVEPRRAATSTKSHPKARRGSSQKQAKGETTDPLAESSLEYSIALSYCCSLRLNKD